ncbi:hypothetical protein TNCV_93981 [Trichonephila clavipes]|nr:hypothetical protein TNCV_93981 [Trichonephila clavipes]
MDKEQKVKQSQKNNKLHRRISAQEENFDFVECFGHQNDHVHPRGAPEAKEKKVHAKGSPSDFWGVQLVLVVVGNRIDREKPILHLSGVGVHKYGSRKILQERIHWLDWIVSSRGQGKILPQENLDSEWLPGTIERKDHPCTCGLYCLQTTTACNVNGVKLGLNGKRSRNSLCFLSDENRFCLGVSDSRVLVTRESGEHQQPIYLRPRPIELCSWKKFPMTRRALSW